MERWDVYDREGRLTGRTRGRGEPFAPGEYHLGVSLWVVNGEGQYLVQRRAATKPVHPGKWCVTGGSAQAGETSRQACVREAREEIGLPVGEDEPVFLARRVAGQILFDNYLVFCEFPLEAARLQAEEVSAVRWVALRELIDWQERGDFHTDPALFGLVEAHIRAARGSL